MHASGKPALGLPQGPEKRLARCGFYNSPCCVLVVRLDNVTIEFIIKLARLLRKLEGPNLHIYSLLYAEGVFYRWYYILFVLKLTILKLFWLCLFCVSSHFETGIERFLHMLSFPFRSHREDKRANWLKVMAPSYASFSGVASYLIDNSQVYRIQKKPTSNYTMILFILFDF